MPSYRADQAEPSHTSKATTSFGLSAIERACVRLLVGHTLAVVERELILQTLEYYRGNRTHAADRLCISIRSLRDRIRNFRNQGEHVPESQSASSWQTERRLLLMRH
jgi:two-component system, response regulator FlrC